MASKNIQNLQLLRNSGLTTSHTAAADAIKAKAASLEDGVIVLNRYGKSANDAKTVIGVTYKSGDTKSVTIFDVEELEGKISSASGDSNSKYTELSNKLGTGVTTSSTVTSQLSALSGSSSSVSGDTSVNGAKKYADALVSSARTDLKISSTTTSSDSFLKTYIIKQGGNEVVRIDIPKDLVVSSGSVVKGTWASGNFTENTSGKDTALKLVIANQTTPVYINTVDLVKDHTAGNGISISDTNEVSVKLNVSGNEFLTVDKDGLKVAGVTSAINKAISSITSTTNISDGNVITKISQSSGKVSVTTAQLSANQVSFSAVSASDKVAVASGNVQSAVESLAKSIKDVSNAAITVNGGNGITVSSNGTAKTIAAKAKDNSGIDVTSDGIGIKLATNSGLKTDANGLTIDLSGFTIDCGTY